MAVLHRKPDPNGHRISWTVLDKLCQTLKSSGQEDNPMATMNVSLPDQMKDWVESRAATGRWSNASDYVRDLIRRDQERAEKIAAMQALIDEAIASGISDRSMDEILADAEAEAVRLGMAP
jgi:antitoxin ParD1/3/4